MEVSSALNLSKNFHRWEGLHLEMKVSAFFFSFKKSVLWRTSTENFNFEILFIITFLPYRGHTTHYSKQDLNLGNMVLANIWKQGIQIEVS